jgi:dihydrofolate synthase / folylpolyglutamate synthase
MGFEEAEAYLNGLGIDQMKSAKPTLHRIQALCELLNHPERAVPSIHITGTNGKTSTSRLASALLNATGLTVGTYTSPHLSSMRERIALNGEALSPDAFGDVFDHLIPYVRLVEEKLGEQLSFFEVLTAMFFLWTTEASIDVAIVEVGLGGLWDATNVMDAPVAVVTNVGLDHTGLLGTERSSIAKEKVGIVKEGATLVSAERDPSLVAFIEKQISGLGATSSFVDRQWHVLENRVAVGGRYLSVKSSTTAHEGLFVPLHGAHQGVNAATAIEAVTRFLPARQLDDDLLLEGLAATSVPGRIETLRSARQATVVLDVAHNPDGMSALVTALIEAFAFDKVHFVLGVLEDKDFAGMLGELTRVPCVVYATAPAGVRPVPPQELHSASVERGLEAHVVNDVFTAAKRALSVSGAGELVCVTGSHYVVGEARERLIQLVS